jgi:hypothetical protein
VRRAAAGAALAALVVLAGCRSFAPALPPLPADDPRPAALLGRLLVLGSERNALRGRARVSVDGARGAAFARQLLLLERPARLRLEVLGILGQRVAVLATDGVHYELFRAEQPEIEAGEVHPWTLYEAAGIPLTPEEAVQLALGTPLSPGNAAPVPEEAAVLPDGSIRVELQAAEGAPRRTLEFAPDGALSRYAVSDPAGGLVLEARYADYREVGGAPFAHQIRLDLPPSDSHAEIRFQWVELNPRLSDDLFRLRVGDAGAGSPWPSSAS